MYENKVCYKDGGVYSVRDIKKGEIICNLRGHCIREQNENEFSYSSFQKFIDRKLPPKTIKFIISHMDLKIGISGTNHVIYGYNLEELKRMRPLFLGSLIRHSDDSNCLLISQLTINPDSSSANGYFRATIDIPKDTEIFYKYTYNKSISTDDKKIALTVLEKDDNDVYEYLKEIIEKNNSLVTLMDDYFDVI